mgnify:CR=1 FL=1
MLGLLFDGTRRIDRVLHGAYAGDRTDLAIAGHQAGVHLGDAIAGQGGTTAGVEFGSVFHDVDGGDHSLMRRAPDSNNWYPASRARCRSSSTWAMRSGVLCLPRLPLRRE